MLRNYSFAHLFCSSTSATALTCGVLFLRRSVALIKVVLRRKGQCSAGKCNAPYGNSFFFIAPIVFGFALIFNAPQKQFWLCPCFYFFCRKKGERKKSGKIGRIKCKLIVLLTLRKWRECEITA